MRSCDPKIEFEQEAPTTSSDRICGLRKDLAYDDIYLDASWFAYGSTAAERQTLVDTLYMQLREILAMREGQPLVVAVREETVPGEDQGSVVVSVGVSAGRLLDTLRDLVYPAPMFKISLPGGGQVRRN